MTGKRHPQPPQDEDIAKPVALASPLLRPCLACAAVTGTSGRTIFSKTETREGSMPGIPGPLLRDGGAISEGGGKTCAHARTWRTAPPDANRDGESVLGPAPGMPAPRAPSLVQEKTHMRRRAGSMLLPAQRFSTCLRMGSRGVQGGSQGR